jgi:hypothetical protein
MDLQPQTLEEAIKILEASKKKIEAYDKQRERMINYQKNNPQKCREKSNKYYTNIKENNPDRYMEMKERKRQYYNEVVKSKKTIEEVVCSN